MYRRTDAVVADLPTSSVGKGRKAMVASQTSVSWSSGSSYRRTCSKVRWCASHNRAMTAKLSRKVPIWPMWSSTRSATGTPYVRSACGRSTSGSTRIVMAMATTASANVTSRSRPLGVATTKASVPPLGGARRPVVPPLGGREGQCAARRAAHWPRRGSDPRGGSRPGGPRPGRGACAATLGVRQQGRCRAGRRRCAAGRPGRPR